MLFVFIQEEEKFRRLVSDLCPRALREAAALPTFSRSHRSRLRSEHKGSVVRTRPVPTCEKKVVLCLIKRRNEREKAGSQSESSRHGGTVDSPHICAAVASRPTVHPDYSRIFRRVLGRESSAPTIKAAGPTSGF